MFDRFIEIIPKARLCFLLIFLFCLGLLLAALYFQFSEGLEPCPLCISQRIMVLLVAIVSGTAALHNPGNAGIKVYAVSGLLAALAGASVSGRHVWIQHLPPDQVPTCGPGLEYMLKNLPIGDTLHAMLSGTGECAKVDWSLLGLSMPAWLMLCFLGLGAFSLLQFWNAERN